MAERQKIFDDALKHADPSNETKKFMDKTKGSIENINTSVEVLRLEIGNIKEKIGENSNEHKEIISELKTFVSKSEASLKSAMDVAERKYAIKLIEKIVFGMVSLVLISIIGALINLVLNQPK